MDPFKLGSALFAKHAQHVVLIHFPIALFISGVAFDVLAMRTKKPAFAEVAYYNLLLAATSSVPVIVTGLLAWQWALGGVRLKGILLLHLVLGLTASVLMCIVAAIHVQGKRQQGFAAPRSRLALEIFAAMLVGLTGHLGGFLSGVNTPGP